MIVFPGHSGCFVPVMRFRVAVPTIPVFQFIRGSLPLAFCFVPVMRFRVAVPTIPVFSVYPRQFAFDFWSVFFRLLFHLLQSRIAQKKSDEFMNCPLRFLALRGNEHFQFPGISDRFAEIVVFVSFRLLPRVFIK